MAKKAIITGVTGQDGAYLSQLLLQKGYQIYGTYRRVTSPNFWRIQELDIKNHPNFHLTEHDLIDSTATFNLIQNIQPDEIYNLAAQSFVRSSFDQPIATTQINSLSVAYLLEAIRIINPRIKFYQASTSELFGKASNYPSLQNEQTPFYPRSPYGVSKLYAHWLGINYRESYNMFISNGILFNHESPLRGNEFVTRKITDSVAKIHLNQLEYFELGNLYSRRDWGFAKEYVEGMWKMLQIDMPDTFVLATGTAHSVKEFVELAFSIIGTNIIWQGEGVDEVGIDSKNNKIRVRINPKYYRPAEVDFLAGDASKAHKMLGWNPKCSLHELCKLMLEADIQRNQCAL